MRSQWESLLQNLGEWQGSFTQVSPQGGVLEDTTTIVSLEGINNNQTVRQTLRFFRAGGVDEKVLEYSSLGRGVMFFENGAFSQGSTQWGPFSEFGAEFGLIHGNRRLRLVQLFNRDIDTPPLERRGILQNSHSIYPRRTDPTALLGSQAHAVCHCWRRVVSFYHLLLQVWAFQTKLIVWVPQSP